MNKIEWVLSTVLTYALIFTTLKVADPGLLNHINEPQIAIGTGAIIALMQAIRENLKLRIIKKRSL